MMNHNFVNKPNVHYDAKLFRHITANASLSHMMMLVNKIFIHYSY